MRESHLDALAIVPRLLESFSSGERACDIASSLINAARNLADRCVGAAPALGWTQSAIAHAAAVKESGSVIYECPGRRQIFADWTDVGVARRVVLEVLAREGAVFSPGLV